LRIHKFILWNCFNPQSDQTMITKFFSSMVNAALACDPETREKLSKYHLKKIRINIVPLTLSYIVEIKDKIIYLSKIHFSEKTSHIDAEISGTPINFISLAFNKSQKLNQLKDITITGDLLFVQEIEKIFTSLDIDFEEKLSYLVGDTTAYTLFQSASSINQCITHFQKRIKNNIKEYIEDEKRIIVSRNETKDFCADVDSLRHQVERLEAKINIIIGQHNS